MNRVKVFAKSEVDLTHKVGAYAYTLYGYADQLTYGKPFKNGIKTMTHADCMAFVNALHRLSTTEAVNEVVDLEIVTDSQKVIALIEEGKGEKHCEDAAKYWIEVVKPRFIKLERITIIKTDRKGMGATDNLTILKRLKELAEFELNKTKELAH